jgi:hypothetical protein
MVEEEGGAEEVAAVAVVEILIMVHQHQAGEACHQTTWAKEEDLGMDMARLLLGEG